VVAAAGTAAAVSVVLSALAFTLEYAVGGTGTASVATVAGAMVGVHVLIGVGEGVITALVVGAVLATRPDLVWGARDLAIDQADAASVAGKVAA
jgi:cobalt/nickel transport system permease protein